MTDIDNNNTNDFYRNVCIVMIWCTAVYSSIIQYIFYQISNAMLILGAAVLVFYILASNGKIDFYEMLTAENRVMLYFMVYMLISGLFFSPDKSGHISQWITCMEYLFVQIVVASILMRSGNDTFHNLLLIESIILAAIFIRHPVDYVGSGRYSISNEVNPNSLGMTFAAGIWAILYRQQKIKSPLILTGAFIALFGYCIILTGSRKSLIGAGLIIMLWLLFCFLPSLKGKGFGGAITLVFVIIIAIIIGRVFESTYFNSKLAERMGDLFFETSEGKRHDMYLAGYEMWKTNPLFGIGFQGFKHNYGYYSHATLVEVPVSGGIIGALLYFYAYYISITKVIYIFKKTQGSLEFTSEHMRIKMLIILLAVMLFYTICIIHPYQFDSGILFGIIFGETAYIENRLNSKQDALVTKRMESKYIKYE